MSEPVKRVERISDGGKVTLERKDAPTDCPWCGADCDDKELCSARCELSRRVDRMDAK